MARFYVSGVYVVSIYPTSLFLQRLYKKAKSRVQWKKIKEAKKRLKKDTRNIKIEHCYARHKTDRDIRLRDCLVVWTSSYLFITSYYKNNRTADYAIHHRTDSLECWIAMSIGRPLPVDKVPINQDLFPNRYKSGVSNVNLIVFDRFSMQWSGYHIASLSSSEVYWCPENIKDSGDELTEHITIKVRSGCFYYAMQREYSHITPRSNVSGEFH